MIERTSETWQRVEELAADESSISMSRICEPRLDIVATEYHRGRLSAFKQILDLAVIKENPLHDLGEF